MIDPRVDAAVIRRLLRHEAEVHAIPGRTLRDLGDALLLHDPVEAEPFWNRVEAIQWPDDPTAFDRRLAEIGVLFATIGRRPHFWTVPPHDTPADLIPRLFANGFEDVGDGLLLVARDGDRFTVRVNIAQTPQDSAWELPNEAGHLNIDSFTMAGDGILTIDPAQPLPVDGELTLAGDQAYSDPEGTTKLAQSLQDRVHWQAGRP